MGIFKKSKQFAEQVRDLISEDTEPTYEYSDEQEAFLHDFFKAFHTSEDWYRVQQDVIAWLREEDFREYRGLEDWQLAWIMDTFMEYDLSDLVKTGLYDLDPKVGAKGIKFLASYFGMRAANADQIDREIRVEIMMDVFKGEDLEEIKKEGSLFRWIQHLF